MRKSIKDCSKMKKHITIFWLALCLLSVFLAPVARSQENWSSAWYPGMVGGYVNAYLPIKNVGTADCTIQFKDLSGGYSLYTGSGNRNVSGAPPGTCYVARQIGGGSDTIAPGATTNYIVEIWCTFSDVGTGSYNVTFELPFRAVYGLGTYDYQPNVIAQNWIINVAYSGYGVHYPVPYLLPVVEVDGEPVRGAVSVTTNFDGPYQIHIGSEVIEMTSVAGATGQWLTNNPGDYADGLPVEIWREGVMLESSTIVKGSDGAFETFFNIIVPDPGPDELEPPEEIPDQPDPPVSPNTPATSDPGQYGGRDPHDAGGPTGDGAPAAGDESAPDTVADMYRAVRQGTADALNQDIPNPEGIQAEAQTSDVAEKVDGKLKEAIDKGVNVSPFAGVSAPGGGGGSGVVTYTLLGHTTTISPPAWASSVRNLISYVVAFAVLITMVNMFRKAFAN